MQITIEPVLSIYVNDNGTLFCLIYKNRNIEKAEKRYKIEKEEKSFQRNGWSRKKALRRNLKKDFRKVCDWHLHIPFDDNFENDREGFLLDGTSLKFISYQVMPVNENFRI